MAEALKRIPEEFTQYEEEKLVGPMESMGFALRKHAKRTRFIRKQRDFLIQKFDEGKSSGNKFDARDISKQMRILKEANSDQPVFTSTELLTWQQIASFWSTYAHKNERNEPLDNENDSVEDMLDEAYTVDPNFQTDDDLIEQTIDEVIRNL